MKMKIALVLLGLGITMTMINNIISIKKSYDKQIDLALDDFLNEYETTNQCKK